MAVEAIDVVPDVAAAKQLRKQAATLTTRAEKLREEYLSTMADARALERDADDIEAAARRRPAQARRLSAARAPAEHDTETLGRVCDTLNTLGPSPASTIAEHTGLTPLRTKRVLERLMSIGMVIRTGAKRGTRYRLADEQDPEKPEHATVAEFGNYATAIRDVAVRLDTFTLDDLAGEFPEVSGSTLKRWTARLVERGTLAVERVDGVNVYAYVKPEGGHVARRRHESPESIAARTTRLPARGRAVQGTGKGTRSGSSVVNELLRELRSDWPQVDVRKRTHKFAFLVDGREVSNCSTTPGASALGETRRLLRNAGIMVAP